MMANNIHFKLKKNIEFCSAIENFIRDWRKKTSKMQISATMYCKGKNDVRKKKNLKKRLKYISIFHKTIQFSTITIYYIKNIKLVSYNNKCNIETKKNV